MKFTTTSLLIAAIMALGTASAAKPTSSVVTVTLPGTNATASPTDSASPTESATSSGIATATKTATITVPIMTTITIGVPTIITTTTAPSGTPAHGSGSAGNAIQAPVKAMMAIGGVAALAQFF
ncbi:hypothetical protein BGX30_013890 [Mortierella sp. GBA39]|nr:hypothetical protein BGX30_013890 [Mortierella sp. GBA39]